MIEELETAAKHAFAKENAEKNAIAGDLPHAAGPPEPAAPGETEPIDYYGWIHTERLLGEPDHRMPFWPLPGELEEHALQRNQLSAARHAVQWLRQELTALRDEMRGVEAHTEQAKLLKAELVKALAELKPMAVRNAKRGKPALLRLLLRAVRTKL